MVQPAMMRFSLEVRGEEMGCVEARYDWVRWSWTVFYYCLCKVLWLFCHKECMEDLMILGSETENLSSKAMRMQISLQLDMHWNGFPRSTVYCSRIILLRLRPLPRLSQSFACQEVSDNLKSTCCVQLWISYRSVTASTMHSLWWVRLTEKFMPCSEPGCE